MKTFHEKQNKNTPSGCSKNIISCLGLILLAAYALIKIIFESSSLKSQKYVHGQATSSRLTV